MGLNYRAAFNILGVILTILSVIFMLPVIVSIIYHEYTNALIFTGTAAAVFIAGLPLRRMTKSQLGDLGIREGFCRVINMDSYFVCRGIAVCHIR